MLFRIALACALLAGSALARVAGIEITERSVILNGSAWGSAGVYERVAAKVRFTVDPQLPANQIISDIDFAPRNAAGQVEFSADLFLFKPVDATRGNGTILLEVSNRGNKRLLHEFCFAPGLNDPHSSTDFGDQFLLEQGYTLVWVGWQFDVPAQQTGLLRLYPPVARDGDRPISGLVRAEYIPLRTETGFSLADRQHVPYAVADPADPSLQLTVRSSVTGPRRVIPRGEWQLARVENGSPVPDPAHVYVAKGLEAGQIYELVYRAQDPALVGLGPTAIRDLISFLKYPVPGAARLPLADLRASLRRAIAYGRSQSGRFLRTFVYQGFNADEQGRQVFDGLMVHVAGGGRGSFNHRFAQPSRDGHPFLNTLYPTDLFPFTDEPQADRLSGEYGGLLDRVRKAGVAPRIFYTNSSYEYWGRAAALTHITIDGRKDIDIPETSRIYLLSGAEHGSGTFPPQPSPYARNLPNANDYRFAMRGLLDALNAWITSGTEPPPSQYPRIAGGTLTPLERWKFPNLPGVTLPTAPLRTFPLDFGPDFRTRGIISVEPPRVGKPYPLLIPQTDADGNELAGIRLPEISVPLATYTGWNVRTPATGAPRELYEMVGSFLPLPATEKDRQRTKDPRLSIERRYPTKEAYLERIRRAAQDLISSGYVLARDQQRLEQRASQMWDALAGR